MIRWPQQLQQNLNQLHQSRRRKQLLPVSLAQLQLWRGRTVGNPVANMVATMPQVEATPDWPRPTVQLEVIREASRWQTRGQQTVSGKLPPTLPWVSLTITSGQKGQSPLQGRPSDDTSAVTV